METKIIYNENRNLDEINSALRDAVAGGSIVINGKLESYSIIRNQAVMGRAVASTGVRDGSYGYGTTRSTFRNPAKLYPPLSPRWYSSSVMKGEESSAPTSSGSSCTTSSSASATTGMGSPVFPRKNAKRDRTDALKEPTILHLVSIMNDSFPDYDFGSAKSEQFIPISLETAMRSINNHLSELTYENNAILDQLWRGLDGIVNLRKSSVFTFKSDEDYMCEGALWSFNFFFVSYETSRVCFFNCSAKSKVRYGSYQDYSDDEDQQEVGDTANWSMLEDDSDVDDGAGEMEWESEEGEDEDDVPEWIGII
jgi:hypothetical protein